MVSKKGEGVRGVLGGLVSRDREPRDQTPQPAPIAEPVPQMPEPVGGPEPIIAEAEPQPQPKASEPSERVVKKASGIKGRPRSRKDKDAAPPGERVKVTLSIDETLRDQFYLLAHGEMMQPGEFVERALRYYIKHNPRKA